ncbi:MAG: phosphotransferase family protein, partial [Waddliaceae bacterium]
IPMPKPIGFLLDPQWTLQEKVEGTRLGAMVNSESFGEIIKKTATLIARFHNLEIPLCNTRKLDQELRMINPRCEVLIHLFPDLKQRLESLRKKIIADLERRIDIRAPIHADFHHTTLLVDGTRVRLIDVDEMAFGDPCVDIGRFLSSLRIPSLRAFGSFEGLEPMRELFLETYLKNTPGNIQNIRLFESASLLTSAASVFRSQRPDWKNEVQMLLDDSERTFEKARERKTLPFSSHCDRWKKLSLESRLKWALDKTYIHALLTPALFEKTRQTLVFCKNLGYKEEESVYQIIYKTITRKGREKTTKELELLLFKKRSGRSVYKHLLAVNEAARKKGLPTLQPDPIAYFTELGALVLEVPKEKALLYREPKT